MCSQAVRTLGAADDSASDSGQSEGGKLGDEPLRRGKWTSEEEEYVARIISDFNLGLLPVVAGTTLRTCVPRLTFTKVNCSLTCFDLTQISHTCNFLLFLCPDIYLKN